MKPFAERYASALADANIAGGLLEFQRSWREARDAQIATLPAVTGQRFEELRDELAAAKDRILAALPRYVAEFKTAAEAAGAVVVEVSDDRQANEHVARLCRARGVDLVVKGKSMVSEELELNDFLARRGVRAVETDLGEWLLQLAGDRPSHLVMPAIHKRRHQVAELLRRVLGRELDRDDVGAMVRAARTELRQRFLTAGMGLSGANALIAETGTVMLVTNEGNNRLCTSLPPIHVVTAGIEKLVPTFRDAVTQIRLLARSATAQPITTYTTFITGPTEGHELHIVLIDNGRSRMAADPDFAPALRCIRCGACANVCPPYQVVGGHAFGHIYSGAIGLVNTPFHHGLDAAAGPQSLCLSCGACATVCPVAIPLPDQILKVRRRVAEEIGSPWWRRVGLRLYASRTWVGASSRLLALAIAPLRAGGFLRLPFDPRHTSWRSLPVPPLSPARSDPELLRAKHPPIAETAATGRRVTLFLQCLTDRALPDIARSTAELLRAAGARIHVPREQHCCGLVAFDSGDWHNARRMARATIETLDGDGDVVTPAPSCIVTMLDAYPALFQDDPEWLERARRLADRVHDLVGYLTGPAQLPAGALATRERAPVAVHRFCQSSNVLGRGDRIERLLEEICDVEVVPLPEREVCCGFGGLTSVTAPEVAAGILRRKLDCIDGTGVTTLVTDNPGCILHLRGGAHASQRTLEVLHVSEFLARRLRDKRAL